MINQFPEKTKRRTFTVFLTLKKVEIIEKNYVREYTIFLRRKV